MKQFFYISVIGIIYASLSCTTYRRQLKTAESMESSYNGFNSFRYDSTAYYQDSVHRIWYFRTDSVLHYHPDRGLSASSGWFWVQEKSKSTQSDRLSIDSARMKQLHQEDEVRYSDNRKLPMDYFWIAILLVLGVLGSLYWRWRR